VSGCLLRCSYCHNPDTWHLKDGTYIKTQEIIDRLGKFALALRHLDGGLTISGGEPMVQQAFTRRILAGAKQLGLHTAIETSGYLGDRIDDRYLPFSISAARHKEFKPRKISFRHRTRSGSNTALCGTPGSNRKAGVGALHARSGID